MNTSAVRPTNRIAEAGVDLLGLSQTRVLVKMDDVPAERLYTHPVWPLCRALGAVGFSSIFLEGAIDYFEPLAQVAEGFDFVQVPGLWANREAAAGAPEVDVIVDLGSRQDSKDLSAWLCRERAIPLISAVCGGTSVSVRVCEEPKVRSTHEPPSASEAECLLLPPVSRIAAGVVLQELLIMFGGIEAASPPASEICYNAASVNRTCRSAAPKWLAAVIDNAVIEVVGAGALGVHFLESFAPLLRKDCELRIFDHDSVNEVNLPLQITYSEDDIGKAKVDAISTRLAALCDESLTIRPFASRYEDRKRGLSRPTLRVLCPDNFAVRKYANDLSLRDGVPLVEAGSSPLVGQQRTFVPGLTACLEHQIHGLPLKAQAEQEPASCAHVRALTLPGVNALLGGILTTEALRAMEPGVFGPPSKGTITFDARLPDRFGIVAERPSCHDHHERICHEFSHQSKCPSLSS